MSRGTWATAASCALLALLLFVGVCSYADARLSQPDPTPTTAPVRTLPPVSTPTRAVVATLAPTPPERLPRPATRVASPSPTSLPALVLPEPTVRPATPTAAVQKGLMP